MGTCSTRFKEHPMKPWIKRSLFGVFGATVLLGGMAACANNRFEHGPMSTERMAQMRGKVIERVSGKLDLTPAQQQKLGVLADTLQAQRLAMMGSTPEPRTAMQALIAGDKFDRSGAQALLSEKTQAVNTGSPAVIAALGDFYDSLNATPAPSTPTPNSWPWCGARGLTARMGWNWCCGKPPAARSPCPPCWRRPIISTRCRALPNSACAA
jgi:protein CpxP